MRTTEMLSGDAQAATVRGVNAAAGGWPGVIRPGGSVGGLSWGH